MSEGCCIEHVTIKHFFVFLWHLFLLLFYVLYYQPCFLTIKSTLSQLKFISVSMDQTGLFFCTYKACTPHSSTQKEVGLKEVCIYIFKNFVRKCTAEWRSVLGYHRRSLMTQASPPDHPIKHMSTKTYGKRRENGYRGSKWPSTTMKCTVMLIRRTLDSERKSMFKVKSTIQKKILLKAAIIRCYNKLLAQCWF